MMYVKIETANDNYNLMVQWTDDIYEFIDNHGITDYDIWVSYDNISYIKLCELYHFF